MLALRHSQLYQDRLLQLLRCTTSIYLARVPTVTSMVAREHVAIDITEGRNRERLSDSDEDKDVAVVLGLRLILGKAKHRVKS